MDEQPQPYISARENMGQGKFLSLENLTWHDTKGQTHFWEMTRRLGNPGAVLIIPRLMPSNRYILIKQFRPPVNGNVMEFPAGLINDGEAPELAAARELREETGYVADTMRVFPAAYTTPGLTNESVFLALVDIDETCPENQNPTTDFDPGEMIETLLIPETELASFYQKEIASGTQFDSKLAIFILTRP
jgi:NTP pyrophosphohydrolases including oxidative damage repair enzymes